MRQGDRFELAVEASIPADIKNQFKNGGYDACQYELAIGTGSLSDEMSLVAETLWLKPEKQKESTASQAVVFPEPNPPRKSLVHPPGGKTPSAWNKVVNKI